jgi:hypothetical protein
VEASRGIGPPPLSIEAEHAFVRVAHVVGSEQERAKCGPRDEPSDMGPPSNASAGGGVQKFCRRPENLKQEPETNAWTSMNRGMNRIGTSTTIRARGNRRM